jgi:hypothetical protein
MAPAILTGGCGSSFDPIRERLIDLVPAVG